MTSAWRRIHEAGDAADAALEAAMAAFGSPEFPALLARYHTAMRSVCELRLGLRIEQDRLARATRALARRQRRARRADDDDAAASEPCDASGV